MMDETSLLHSVIIFLLAGVVMVPIAQKIRLGAVLGYLLAGVMIGPFALGFIKNVDEILHFSELGVVFLMFLIGLELHPSKLWALRRSILGAGAGQVIFTSIALAGVLILVDFSWQAALVGGLGMAMSSTAMALQLMGEKGMTNRDNGQLGFSVLLFQDMAVIPILAIIPLLAGETASSDWYRIGLKVLAFAGLWFVGRYLLRPLFRLAIKSGVHEVFTAASLFVVIGAALLMESLGFSMALGTFIAGVLLADTEFRHELEVTIEPFKGLLLGLFFISVGMSLNLGVLWQYFPYVLLGVVALVLIKFFVLFLLGWRARLNLGSRLQFAGVLSQGGEFAFVIFSTALALNVVSVEQMALLLVVVTLSMMTTPLLMSLIDVWLNRRYNNQREADEQPYVQNDEPQVILIGFGRMGQVVGRLLMANRVPITVLERDVSSISTLRRYGYKVYYGDARELNLLRAAGAEKAKSIVITSDVPEEVMEIVALCQEYFPNLHIIARARGRVEAHELLERGVNDFSRETFSSALELGKKALVSTGMHVHQAYRAKQHFRRLDMRMLRDIMPSADEDVSQISRIKEARRELNELFQQEIQREARQPQRWEQQEERKADHV